MNFELVTAADARDTPSCWWPRQPVDPRHTRGWAIGSRWPDDGVFFAGLRGSDLCAMARRAFDGTGYSRMNLVDACAGTYRDVAQPPGLIASARKACARQVVMATTGYATSVIGAAGRATARCAASLVTELARLAEKEGAAFGVLHIPGGEISLLSALRTLDFHTEITDVYAEIPLGHDDFDGYLNSLDAKHRGMVRREHRRLREAGGEVRIFTGIQVAEVADLIGALEAASQSGRGIATDPRMLADSIRALARELDTDFAAAVVYDRERRAVASCSVVSAGEVTLCKTVGLDRARARALDGYFHATYYTPIKIALARGSARLVLGPGSLRPKLVRGAVLRPLWAGVRSADESLVDLLSGTGAHMRTLLTPARES